MTVLIFLNAITSAQSGSRYHSMLNSLYSKSVPLIKPYELIRIIEKNDNIILLDTREPDEYKVSHIRNALHVGYESFNISIVAGIPKDAVIVAYCSIGYRSERVGEKLIRAGYVNTMNLYGGIFEWINNGYPVIDPDNKTTQRIHPYNKKWGKWLEKGIKTYE
ncbi:MAG: rhodanese-like domain-containing protein [Bacteroidales bacterium]|nr:rhodanese-like domain-containing protein [Bacteroidales bacterium]MDT8374233.1 rhodanese-like domain-containing protein [Bacteroidales bacterium]